jgi:hypothetical protein
MPALRNSRHEAFCQALFKQPQTGMSQGECYTSAGYRAKGHSAEELGSRLNKVEAIRNRVAELQEAMARRAEITVASICEELDRAVALAEKKGQATAMVSASHLRAKLGGLLKERIEVSHANPFQACQSLEQLAEKLLRENYGLDPSPDTVASAVALLAQQQAELDALAAGRGPITIEHESVRANANGRVINDPKRLPWRR